MLAANNELVFTELMDEANAGAAESLILKDVRMNPLTRPEIVECCRDLKVLGRKDFKSLLKWRKNLRELLLPAVAEVKVLADDEIVEELQSTAGTVVGDVDAELEVVDQEIVELERLND